MGPALTIEGDPTDEEAVAIAAAVTAALTASTAPGDPRPAVYRSAWRRAAIDEGVMPIARRRNTPPHAGTAHQLEGWGNDVQ